MMSFADHVRHGLINQEQTVDKFSQNLVSMHLLIRHTGLRLERYYNNEVE